MSSIPSFGSYAIADPQSKDIWRVTTNPVKHATGDDGASTSVDPKVEHEIVEISQEGRNRYRVDAEKLAAAGEAGTRHGVVESGKIHIPVMTPEERERFEWVFDADAEFKARGEVLSKLNPEFLAINERMEDAYADFVNKFLNDNPDFKDASFGFSVDATGKLVAKNTDGLNAGQIFRFEKALNESTELVKMSSQLADLNIQIYDAENHHPYFKFDRNTFAQTIDLGAALLTRHAARHAPRDETAGDVHMKNWDNNWRQQLVRNGERNPPDAEIRFYSAP